jgi:NADPH:quinone reductase-like Zn-dependent oxidoreductase
MKAIVVNDFKQTPRWDNFNEPTPQENEVLIKVKAAALSNLVKARADGTHYSSIAKFPFIPGVDGVGQLEDGSRVYFSFPRHPFGSMAEYSVANKATCIPLPDELDDVIAASIANPAMSSWGALVYRAQIMPGEIVLINGASGVSGSLAINIAKLLFHERIASHSKPWDVG